MTTQSSEIAHQAVEHMTNGSIIGDNETIKDMFEHVITKAYAPVTAKAALADEAHNVLIEINTWLGTDDGEHYLPIEPPWYKNLRAVVEKHIALTASPLSPETETENRQALAAEIESE